MTPNEYQKEALKTANGMSKDYPMLFNGMLGLAGESGECSDIVKKHFFQGHELNETHLAEGLGDVAWYLAVSVHEIGYDLDTILQMNVDKLRKRYPDGFEAERSIHRETSADDDNSAINDFTEENFAKMCDIVSERSDTHKPETRQDKFLKKFPNAEIYYLTGHPLISPCELNTKMCEERCDKYSEDCNKRSADYWGEKANDKDDI